MTYTINCPECNAEINVEEALAKKFAPIMSRSSWNRRGIIE